MRRFLFLILGLCLASHAQADFVVGIGAGATTEHSTKQEGSNGKEVLDFDGGLGLGAEFELLLTKALSLSFSGLLRGTSGNAQYSFTDKSSNTTYVADDLTVSGGMFAVAGGPRIRFLNLNRFRMFVGGGYTVGVLGLTYDEDDYEEKNNNSSTGLEEEESKTVRGPYYEAGAEYVISADKALRLSGRQTRYQTDHFETLGNKRLDLRHTQIMLQYLQYVKF